MYDATGKEVARLIDDKAMETGTHEATFNAAGLSSGTYYYTLKAEINRDGKPMTETRRVTVQAGRESQVKFDFNTSVAQR